MKLTIAKDALLGLLTIPASIATHRHTMPILATVRLAAQDDVLRLDATDLETCVTETVACEVDKPGVVCLDAKLLNQIVRGAPGETVKISVGENLKTTIEAGGSRFRLNGLSAEECPQINTKAFDESSNSVSAALVSEAFASVKHCMSTDEARYNLNGVCLVPQMTQTIVVATDGHRLAKFTGDFVVEWLKEIVIVPRAGVAGVVGFLESAQSEVSVSVDGSMLHMSRPGCAVSVRLVDGSYPAYEKVIPSDAPVGAIAVERESLLAAVKRVLLVTTDKTKVVKVELREDSLVLTASSPEHGEAKETIDCSEVRAKDFSVGVSGRYLIDAFGVLDCENVTLDYRNEVGPIVIKESEPSDLVQVIMPVRFEGR